MDINLRRFIEDQKVCDYQRRLIRGICYLLWLKFVKAVDTAEIQLAGPALARSLLEFPFLQAIGNSKISEFLRSRVEPGQPMIGTDPKIALIVFLDAKNALIG